MSDGHAGPSLRRASRPQQLQLPRRRVSTPRSWSPAPRCSTCRRWRSPTTPASTARCGSGRRRARRGPMRRARRGCGRCGRSSAWRWRSRATRRELRLARRGRRLNDPFRGERASRGWPGELHGGPIPGDHLVLLARDAAGYAALSRLASRGHLAGEKQFPVFERSLVETALDDARGHLVALTGCRNGEVPRHLLAGDPAAARAAAERWARPPSRRRPARRADPPPQPGRRLARRPASSSWRRPPACRTWSATRCITPRASGSGSRTCSSASVTGRPSARRASSSCRTPSTG